MVSKSYFSVSIQQCYGEMEGQHFSVLLEAAEKFGVPREVYTPKGGETVAEINERVREFFMVSFCFGSSPFSIMNYEPNPDTLNWIIAR